MQANTELGHLTAPLEIPRSLPTSAISYQVSPYPQLSPSNLHTIICLKPSRDLKEKDQLPSHGIEENSSQSTMYMGIRQGVSDPVGQGGAWDSAFLTSHRRC